MILSGHDSVVSVTPFHAASRWFRRLPDGLWYIEKGKIQYPGRNFRFKQSVLGLLAPGNVQMIGKSERVSSSESQGSGASLTPAIMMKEFHFSFPSDAI